jgi:hypothetical protein
MTSNYLKRQFPYELKNTYACKETGKHLLEIKISGKSQSISYLAEEIAIDDDFITRFSPTDIRTISYLAACDKYETILQEEKIKKSYEIARSKNINGNKTILLKHKITDESIIVLLKNFANSDLIEKLDAQDVYQVGYLAGQEQFLKDNVRKNMTLIKNTEYQHDNVS